MRPSRKRAPAPAASCINWAKGSGRQAGAKLRRQEQRAVVRRRRRGLRAQDGGRERRQGQQLPVVYLTHLENTTLPAIYHALNVAGAAEVRTIEMAQGKRSAASSPGPSTTPSNRPPGSRTLALTLPAPVILTAPTKSAFYLSIFITYVILNTGLIIKILGYWFI